MRVGRRLGSERCARGSSVRDGLRGCVGAKESSDFYISDALRGV